MVKFLSTALRKLPRKILFLVALVGLIAVGGGGLAAYSVLAGLPAADQPLDASKDDLADLDMDSLQEETDTTADTKKSQNTKKTKKPTTAVKKPSGSSLTPSDKASPVASPASKPKPSAGCPNSTHTPGGSDGVGGCWPYAGNTGVPSGVSLSAYSGPCSIFTDTIIQNKTVNCALQMYDDASLTVRNSVVKGFIENTYTTGVGKLLVEDSEIQAGAWSGGAAWGSSMTIRRSELTGGQHSVHCESNCTITDSWLHNQYNPDGGSYHNNAFLSNGGTNMHLSGNTLHCTALLNDTDGGCTSNLTLLGDFDTISYVNATSNLMMANNSSIAYCVVGGYAPSKPYPIAHHVVMQNNVFQRGPNKKCGVYGPVTSFQTSAAGNVWSGNKWADGSIVTP